MKLIRENNKTILSVTLLIILITPIFGNFARVFLFKNVQIPFNIKHKNSKIRSGKYDIEIVKHTGQIAFYLRFKKRGRNLCHVRGEQLFYKSKYNAGMEQLNDPDIPDHPTLKIKKDQKENIIYFIFESGKKTPKYPFIKMRFKFNLV